MVNAERSSAHPQLPLAVQVRQLHLELLVAVTILGHSGVILVGVGLGEPCRDGAQLLLQPLDLRLQLPRLAPGAAAAGRLRRGRLGGAGRGCFGFGGACLGGSLATTGSWSRAYSPNPPSRSRSRPFSMAMVRVARASIRARSWDTNRIVPGKLSRASSSASRLSMSRWLVGSSSTSRFAPETTIRASASRRRSPPDSTLTGFSTWSPENRKRPSSIRACGPVSFVPCPTASTSRACSGSSSACCE